MVIDENSRSVSYYYGLYNNKPAYKSFYDSIIYVFKDISAKRVKTGNDFTRDNKRYKIVFVTNKQLLAMDYFDEVKSCVFDGKLGTRYQSKSSMGSYHWCLRAGGDKPVALSRH